MHDSPHVVHCSIPYLLRSLEVVSFGMNVKLGGKKAFGNRIDYLGNILDDALAL